jgi:ketosteroid isomerase-like protein
VKDPNIHANTYRAWRHVVACRTRGLFPSDSRRPLEPILRAVLGRDSHESKRNQTRKKMGQIISYFSHATMVTALSMLCACATSGAHKNPVVGAEEVRATEIAFAKAMADRDFNAFVSHLSGDAVFIDEQIIRRGAAEVSAAWKPLFVGPKASFSWAPDRVEVLASGDLALSTGPVIVHDKVVGRFNSIWRLEAPHTWRIVFDKGEPVCNCVSK